MNNGFFIPKLSSELIFPDPRQAIHEGLVAFGGDLSVSRLILAYKEGIFPWYSEGDPILWWCPHPRLVLYPEKFKISKSLAKTIKKKKFEVRVDTRFRDVISSCSNIKRPGEDGTWILEEVIDAYTALHEEGFAHSFETYLDGKLVGGLYGVSLGGAFFGESMFAKESDASKVAVHALVQFCLAHDFDMIDCQVTTEHLVRLGAKEISRNLFLDSLEKTLTKPTLDGKWSLPSE